MVVSVDLLKYSVCEVKFTILKLLNIIVESN